MIYQIIGWLVIVLGVGCATMIWWFAVINNCGQYNIGGCNNSLIKKIITILCVMPILLAWFGVYVSAPFSLVMK